MIEDEELDEAEEVEQRKRVEVLNARIRRWFIYRIARRRRQTAGLDPRKDPFAVLLSKLSGLTAPPKARQAYQQFMRESYADKIAPVVAERWAAARQNNEPDTVGRKEPKAGFRALVAREVFAGLPDAEKTAIAQRAKEEAAQAKTAYEKALKDPPSNAPADRQRCLDALPDFIAPILRGIQDYTGCHSVLLVGGPMPKYGGRIADVAGGEHFPQWDRERFNTNVLKFMVEYLKTAFSPSDCEKAALAVDLDQAKYTIPDVGVDADVDAELSSSSGSSDEDSDESLSDSSLAPPPKNLGNQRQPLRPRPIRLHPPKTASASGQLRPPATSLGRRGLPATSLDRRQARRPVPLSKASTRKSLRRGLTTVETPMGPVTFPDPTAGIPYARLTLDQQRARNVLRNVELGKLFRKDIGLTPTTAPPAPPAPKPRGSKPAEGKGSAPRRRSQRLANGGAEAAAPLDMDLDTDNQSSPASPPASASEPEIVVRRDSMELDTDGEQSSGWEKELDELEASDMEASAGGGNQEDEDHNTVDNAPSPGARAPDTWIPIAAAAPANVPDAHPLADRGLDPIETPVDAPVISNAAPQDARSPPSSRGLAAENDGDVQMDHPPPPISEPPACPANAAPLNLGPHFHGALNAWTRLEVACKFESPSHKLSTTNRPDEIAKWITGGRGLKQRAPRVENPQKFAGQFWAWWNLLQPDWRTKGDDGRWVTERYGEWDDKLLHWGPNGLLSVLAGVYFWGCAVVDMPDMQDEWVRAVEDVSWILEGLAAFHEEFVRRKRR
ncbi:hypothetical protein MSAN_02332100 [Mycena sanguinolenta]|uniref:Uncharacterized protein n=1 Tax=Mycena sanguinolenta TaxID=230812 RepID=A0A8H6X853_9AGAR|nr:hypothetical protein MSAN_02332100 [Mycena sanguinolenta]